MKKDFNEKIKIVLNVAIFYLLVLIVLLFGWTNKTVATSLDYKADREQIRAELQFKGYTVNKVGFDVSDYGKYVVSVYIDTRGNYDEETLAMHRIMFDNAIADYYFAAIVDYEFLTSWSFTASRQTLSDYFSGKIGEEEYIRQVKTVRIK